MSEYYLVNDVHLSDRPPASCTDTYLDDLFDLLGQISQLAQQDAIIVLAGDIIHHKTPGRTSHATTMRLIDWAFDATAQVYAVLGNHDLSHDRLDSISETQPLGVVIKSGAIKLLDGWIDNGDYVYGVPWQMTFDRANVFDALDGYRHFIGRQPALVVTHAPLYPPGRELKFEYFPVTDWAEAMGGQGTVHYGHVHEPHGVYQAGGVTFSNPGALSRGSLHEHNLTRAPGFAVWDSMTGQIVHHHHLLKIKPASEVFRLQEAAETKAAGVNLSRFLDSIQATQLDITSTASVMAHVRETQDDPALVAVIEKLMESA